MLDTGYLLLGIASMLPVIASVIVFCADRALSASLSYWPRQILIGLLFGGLAVMGTVWGIPLDGYVMNCRDAAVLCAGLLFGGPAGIIAGLIGGIHRYVVVFWGAGAYTQIACSVSTIIAGFIAAAIRVHIAEGKRPGLALAFISGLVVESFHMFMVGATHFDTLTQAFGVVTVCAPPMLAYNSCSVFLATLAIMLISRAQEKHAPAQKDSVLVILQTRLLLFIAIAFLIVGSVQYYSTFRACVTLNAQFLEQTLNNVHQLNLFEGEQVDVANASALANSIGVGETGHLLISNAQSNVVFSGPVGIVGTTLEDHGIAQNRAQSSTGGQGAAVCSDMYEARFNDTACLCMDMYEGNYRITAIYPAKEAYLQFDWYVVYGSLMQIILFAVAFVGAFLVVRRHVVQRIRTVNDSLSDITDGNLDTKVEVRSSLEFEQLSDGINTTVDALQLYTREAKERMERDLEFAKAIQMSALPSHFPPYPSRTDFDIYAYMNTAKEVGGDFYDFSLMRGNELIFIIADVSGKGVPAALFMMRSKTQIKSLVDVGLPVETVFTKANNALNEDNDAGMFLTAWQGSLNVNDGTVCFANAGHNAPIVCHGGKNFELVEDKHNFVLAMFPGIKYDRQELQLAPGDILFLYTDGVTEAANVEGEFYGTDRLLKCLNRTHCETMEALCSAVAADLSAFTLGAAQSDDITMLALRYIGPAA